MFEKIFKILLPVFLLAMGCSSGDLNKKTDQFQAVFLTNGQVYYGKITDSQGQFYTIEDVFYVLRSPSQAEGQAPQLQLIKRGKELHGPTDALQINRDHIAFVEEVGPKGQVMQKIVEYKKTASQQKEGETPPAQQLPSAQMSPQEMEQFRQFQQFRLIQQGQGQAQAPAPSPDKPVGPETAPKKDKPAK